MSEGVLVVHRHRTSRTRRRSALQGVLICGALLLVTPRDAVHAQEVQTTALRGGVIGHVARTTLRPVPPFGHAALARSIEAKRDRGKGALYGLGIGALVGAVGFAAADYALNDRTTRFEFGALSALLGGAIGGAVGAVIGAVVGAPVQPEAQPDSRRIERSPGLGRGGTALTLSPQGVP